MTADGHTDHTLFKGFNQDTGTLRYQYSEKGMAKENKAALDMMTNIMLLPITVLWEPADYAVIGYNWIDGDFSAYDIISLAPGLSNAVARRLGRGVDNGIVDFLGVTGKKFKILVRLVRK